MPSSLSLVSELGSILLVPLSLVPFMLLVPLSLGVPLVVSLLVLWVPMLPLPLPQRSLLLLLLMPLVPLLLVPLLLVPLLLVPLLVPPSLLPLSAPACCCPTRRTAPCSRRTQLFPLHMGTGRGQPFCCRLAAAAGSAAPRLALACFPC